MMLLNNFKKLGGSSVENRQIGRKSLKKEVNWNAIGINVMV